MFIVETKLIFSSKKISPTLGAMIQKKHSVEGDWDDTYEIRYEDIPVGYLFVNSKEDFYWQTTCDFVKKIKFGEYLDEIMK